MKNLPTTLLITFTPRDPHCCKVNRPESHEEIAACTSREAAEAAARLLLWDHDEWYGEPSPSAYDSMRKAFESST